jgi:hypothetical protein
VDLHISSDDECEDTLEIMEEMLRQCVEPLFPGTKTHKLQFSIIVMTLCSMYSLSHHFVDELLTFLGEDVLPPRSLMPRRAYEMKLLFIKLGLSYECIHCYECGKTIYWEKMARLTSCPKCLKSRYIYLDLV